MNMKLGQAQEPVRPARSGLGTNAHSIDALLAAVVFVSKESRDLYGLALAIPALYQISSPPVEHFKRRRLLF